MKYILFALIFSILIHLGIFYKFNENVTASTSKKGNAKSTSLLYVKLQKKKIIKKAAKKENIITKKKNTPQKNITKKNIIKKKYKKVEKKIKKVKKRPVKKKQTIKKHLKISKSTNTIKTTVEKTKEVQDYEKQNNTNLQKSTLQKFLEKPRDNLNDLKSMVKSYKSNHPNLKLENNIELYGEEFDSFTQVQKVFIKDNLNAIGRITQYHLRYPRISVRTKQQGENIITFILYPNGDISKPHFMKQSKYTPLDKQTYETIQIAYKDYPRPKEPTKIIIRVRYKLY